MYSVSSAFIFYAQWAFSLGNMSMDLCSVLAALTPIGVPSVTGTPIQVASLQGWTPGLGSPESSGPSIHRHSTYTEMARKAVMDNSQWAQNICAASLWKASSQSLLFKPFATLFGNMRIAPKVFRSGDNCFSRVTCLDTRVLEEHDRGHPNSREPIRKLVFQVSGFFTGTTPCTNKRDWPKLSTPTKRPSVKSYQLLWYVLSCTRR